MVFSLMKLPYGQSALAPYMSDETLEYHHQKHHQTYITNLNKLLETSPLANKSLEEIIVESYNKPELTGVFNNAGQIYNHNIFWNAMKPNGGGNLPAKLEKHILESYPSISEFKEEFGRIGLSVFGSGWVWAYVEKDSGKIKIGAYAGGSSPLVAGHKPILGCDVWEHAYYIDYRNARVKYLDAFLSNLVNWEFVESQIG